MSPVTCVIGQKVSERNTLNFYFCNAEHKSVASYEQCLYAILKLAHFLLSLSFVVGITEKLRDNKKTCELSI